MVGNTLTVKPRLNRNILGEFHVFYIMRGVDIHKAYPADYRHGLWAILGNQIIYVEGI